MSITIPLSEILLYLKDSVQRAESAGLDPHQIIVDPGIGFGKTIEDNLLIIKNLNEFRVLGNLSYWGHPARHS